MKIIYSWSILFSCGLLTMLPVYATHKQLTFKTSCDKHSKWVERVNQAIEHPYSSIKLLKALCLEAGDAEKLGRKYQRYCGTDITPVHYAVAQADQQRRVVISNREAARWLLQAGVVVEYHTPITLSLLRKK
jgi:hypothetical protein